MRYFEYFIKKITRKEKKNQKHIHVSFQYPTHSVILDTKTIDTRQIKIK